MVTTIIQKNAVTKKNTDIAALIAFSSFLIWCFVSLGIKNYKLGVFAFKQFKFKAEYKYLLASIHFYYAIFL